MNGPDALVAWGGRHLPSAHQWEPIPGATTAQLWRIDGSFVVKAFTDPSFVAAYPDCVDHSVQAMARVATHTDLTIPAVVAADPTGESAGCPALIMTAVQGDPMDVPTRRIFDRIIDVAEQIHTIPPGDFGWAHHRYNEPKEVSMPSWFGDQGLFKELSDRSAAAFSDDVFIHRDFHPGNLLFAGDTVTGVVDWDYACVGPSGEDYGRTWLNLAADYGERISTVFASRAARRLDPQWVAAAWLDWLPFYEGDDEVEQWGTDAERVRFESVGRWITQLT